MPERTVILLTGRTLGAVGTACTLARSLEPAMVVIEDVDLIARDRSHFESAPFLFELLNAMDGLDEDADLIFVLTTNRPQSLAAALAARPGGSTWRSSCRCRTRPPAGVGGRQLRH